MSWATAHRSVPSHLLLVVSLSLSVRLFAWRLPCCLLLKAKGKPQQVMLWCSHCMPSNGDVRTHYHYTHVDDTALSTLSAHSFHCKPTICCHTSLSTYHSPPIILHLSLSTYHSPPITLKLLQSTAHVSHLQNNARRSGWHQELLRRQLMMGTNSSLVDFYIAVCVAR